MRIDDLPLERRSTTWGLAAVVAILLNTVLTAAKEISAPLRDFMAMLTSHHWTTHGVWVLGAFALLGLLFNRMRSTEHILPSRLVWLLIGSTVVAGLGLLGLFFWLSL